MADNQFQNRMTELDAIVKDCLGDEPFVHRIVRDTSNRSNRDWPWWSVEIEETQSEGSEHRRAQATIRLNATQSGEPGSFEGKWLVRIWRGVGVDIFWREGGWRLSWDNPSPKLMRETMIALLHAARSVIDSREQI